MKRLSTIIVLSLILGVTTAMAKGMRFHMIVFCGTNLEHIGESCQSDQDRFLEEAGYIAATMGCEEELLVYNGDSFNKHNLEKTLTELECGPDDVVFFYYSGRGIQAKNASPSTWLPQMCLDGGASDEKNFVSVAYVKEQLQSKGARLNIIMTDCCNTESEWVSVKERGQSGAYNKQILYKEYPILSTTDVSSSGYPNVKKLVELFEKSKGFVIATASKRGQASYTTRGGGCFSKAFWDEMYLVENGKSPAKWESVLEATKLKTLEYTDGKQEPIYQITKK